MAATAMGRCAFCGEPIRGGVYCGRGCRALAAEAVADDQAPTAAEIALECRRIRASWSPEERWRRARGIVPGRRSTGDMVEPAGIRVYTSHRVDGQTLFERVSGAVLP